MSKRARQSKKKTECAPQSQPSLRPGGVAGLLDDVMQYAYPREHRIAIPASRYLSSLIVSETVATPPPKREPAGSTIDSGASVSALAELANCLWYVKTRHFKREWDSDDTADDDPRTRRTLGRLIKGLDALRRLDLEVQDPTGRRYASGSEGMMRPLDFVPTAGLTYERVTEATMPVVFWRGQLIQRAEVFVAVPAANPDPAAADTAGDAASTDPERSPGGSADHQQRKPSVETGETA